MTSRASHDYLKVTMATDLLVRKSTLGKNCHSGCDKFSSMPNTNNVNLFFYSKKQTMKKGKQTSKINNNKLIPLRGFSLRRYFVTRYAVTRFTSNRLTGLFLLRRKIWELLGSLIDTFSDVFLLSIHCVQLWRKIAQIVRALSKQNDCWTYDMLDFCNPSARAASYQ